MEQLIEMMRDAMGPDLFDACERMGANAEAIIRYSPLAHRFQKSRDLLDLTIKEVAAQLKVPQYKIKAIEEGRHSQLDMAVFHKYTQFLHMDEYIASWSQRNDVLARQLGIAGQSVRRPGAGAVYQFKITPKDTKPPIWRRIQVPATYSFWDLHVAIQDAMA